MCRGEYDRWVAFRRRQEKLTALSPVVLHLLYPAVHLVQGLAEDGLQPRPPVVGQAPREDPRLYYSALQKS